MALTQKQEKFVQELVKGKSQREAYKIAYSPKKMTDNSIDVAACKLLKNDKVALRYDEIRTKVTAKAEEEAVMSALEIIKEIESIANDDISNYLEFGTEQTETGERPFVKLKNSKELNTKNIAEISIGANGTFKFKMYSRDTALYKLAELFGVDVLKKAKQRLAEERFEYEKEIDDKKYW